MGLGLGFRACCDLTWNMRTAAVAGLWKAILHITHPAPSEAAKPPKPTPVRVYRTNTSILDNNSSSSLSYVVVVEQILKAHG